MSIDAVLFDLDGTLVDTAPDLVAVLNAMLLEHGAPPVPFAIARNEVSNGALGLIRLGFGSDLGTERYEVLRRRFLEVYGRALHVNSRIFQSLGDILNSFYRTSWGIVTNKPEMMTVPLLEQLGIAGRAGCIISGDRLPQRKPHPAPLLIAAAQLGVPASRCVYVGDAPRDIQAGRAAGMATIVAGYGYVRPSVDVYSWGADRVVRHPTDLAAAIAALADERAGDAA